ncbi:nitrate- and nitrite sensing domain-containing protein [Streptomyces sp. NPDC087300]|uniref:sensor histidine kinase n=1 Tax=Streptomyces sp. NPDC087300 TaxID=3365780 RepID=UPI00382C68D5
MRTPRSTSDPTDGALSPEVVPPARGRRAHAGRPADERDELFYGDEHLYGEGDIAEPLGNGTPTHAGHWRLRPRTVRAKIVCLLMVPVISLLALWGYATVSTAQDVARLRQLQRVDTAIRTPVETAITSLQAERVAAVRYATKADTGRGDALKKQGERTDRAVAKLRIGDGSTVADGAGLPSRVADRLDTFLHAASGVRALRNEVLDRRVGWDTAYGQYTKTITQAFGVGGALTGMQDTSAGSNARVLLEFSRAGEMLAREDAVLAGARLDGSLAGQRLRLFTGAVDTRRTLTETSVADLRGPQRAAWHSLEARSAYDDVRTVEDKVLVAQAGPKALGAAPANTWDDAYGEVRNKLNAVVDDAHHDAANQADPLTHAVLTPAGAAVLLGLFAVAASLVVSVRIGRGLVVELVGLRNGALEIARRKLPNAMRRLRAGEELDVDAEAPPGPPAEDETGQVAEALGTVHRAALRAAVERAELASGISGVFVNLARRSQVLVHRQLSLLDTMERRAEDPNELSDLFRLDHLTTRMRRHAESLIILSGAAPGRAWRMPVSLTNVVRAAVSEVEDYARVEVRQLPGASVLGTAVADLTHLLAELVENAAQFSPPHTKVRVNGEPVGNGYALEIEDRGLGMGSEMLAEANRRIEQSEALDLFDSDQLGLFVVSRLAARHHIKVHLRTSPYGGTTAVVLLPTALLHSGTAESTRSATVERGRFPGSPGSEHARVEGGSEPRVNGNSVHASASRPALAAAVEAPPPPGVTTLRPHRARSTASPDAGSYGGGSLDVAGADAQASDAQVDGARAADPHVADELRVSRVLDSQGADAVGPAPGTDAPADSDTLPRRVRQASLAPQLRERRPAEEAPAAVPGEEGERSPEQVRARMTAYRDGWARGGGPLPGIVGSVPDTSGPAPGRDSSEGDRA